MNSAGASARDAADKAKDKAKRVFVHLDSEYELTSKTARAARKAEEVARDIDQTYGVRRRVRSGRDYVTRNWPTWQRKLDKFSGTWYGKATILGTICIVVSSPLFWSLLNVIILLWWLSIPLSLFLLDYARKQQAQRLQQEAEQAEQARRAANPFADMFKGAWGAAAGAADGSRRTAGGAGQGRFTQQDGPVIEAEWTTIDEGDLPGGERR